MSRCMDFNVVAKSSEAIYQWVTGSPALPFERNQEGGYLFKENEVTGMRMINTTKCFIVKIAVIRSCGHHCNRVVACIKQPTDPLKVIAAELLFTFDSLVDPPVLCMLNSQGLPRVLSNFKIESSLSRLEGATRHHKLSKSYITKALSLGQK